eukprot:503818-Amphidinium_carterae.3
MAPGTRFRGPSVTRLPFMHLEYALLGKLKAPSPIEMSLREPPLTRPTNGPKDPLVEYLAIGVSKGRAPAP